MLKDQSQWFHSTQSLKKNFITRYSQIKFPSNVDDFVVECAVEKIKNNWKGLDQHPSLASIAKLWS